MRRQESTKFSWIKGYPSEWRFITTCFWKRRMWRRRGWACLIHQGTTKHIKINMNSAVWSENTLLLIFQWILCMSVCITPLLRPKNRLQQDRTIRDLVYCIQSLFYFHLHTYELFNDAFSTSDCIASYGKVKSEWWIGWNVGGSGRGLVSVNIPAFA